MTTYVIFGLVLWNIILSLRSSNLNYAVRNLIKVTGLHTEAVKSLCDAAGPINTKVV